MSRGTVHGQEPGLGQHTADSQAHKTLFDAAKAACRPADWTPTAADVGAAATKHTHAPTDVTGLPGTDYSASRVRGISVGTSDLTAGTSDLESGTIYLVYE